MKNSKGYTLLEMLLTLIIFALIALWLVLAIPLLKYQNNFEDYLPFMEWRVFITQAKMEIQSSEEMWILNNRLYLKKDGAVIQYEKYETMIRRKVANEGHEPLLMGIQEVNFMLEGKWLQIRAKTKDGEIFKEKIWLPKHLWKRS